MIKPYTLLIKRLALIVAVLSAGVLHAQSNVSALLPTVASGTYVPVSSPDYTFATGSCDDVYWVSPTATAATGDYTTTGVAGIPMGFSVPVGGISYDKIAISSNGHMTLAPASVTTFNVRTGYTGVSSIPPTGTLVVSPFSRDLQTNTTGSSIKLKSSGTAPNRIYEVEFVNFRNYAGTGQSYTFKTTFNETGAPVVFSYDVINPGTSTTSTFQMGLSSGTTWTNLAGTWATNAPGTTNSASFAVGAVTSGTNVTWALPTFCPINVAPTVTNGTSCGATSVTLGAASSLGYATPYWSSTSNTRIISEGTSFTTPVITSGSTSYDVRLGAVSNTLPAVHGGPSASSITFPAVPTATFSNGMSFTAAQPFLLDSVTVRANGTVKFAILVMKKSGSIYSAAANTQPALVTTLEQRSDTILVNATGSQNVRVPVKLAIQPGEYYIRVVTYAGTTGVLEYATGGVTYPYSLGTLGTIDSVRLNYTSGNYAPLWAFYVYNWRVAPMCFGPSATATATFAPVPAAAIPYSVDFNSNLPCNWTTTSNAHGWNRVTSYGTSSSLNGSAFMFIDDDAAGSSAPAVNASLESPAMNTLGYDSLTLSFSQYYFSSFGQKGFVEVYDGTNWVKIDSMTTTQGSWTTPSLKSYNITSYSNPALQVRFRFTDNAGWGWYWAVDDVLINGVLSPCTNVRVEVVTDIFGSEVTWSIVDTATGFAYAQGGPYPDVTTYSAAAATHIDTVCLPENLVYEFRIEDSFGDGLFDGTNTGTFTVDKLCAWGWNNVISGSGANTFDPGGSTANVPSYDSVVFDMNCIQYSDVTFQVDMNQVTAGFTTPEVNGFWNNWCGNCNAMADANGDGIWTVTLPLPVGDTMEFKYSADAWTIQEMNDPTAPCTNGNATYTNRVLVVPAADTTLPVVCWSSCFACTVDVTLQVNMAWEVANNAISADSIHVAGDFQGWNPGATAMTDANNDGIYEVTVNVPANSSIQYKFINGNAWGQDEPVPGACAVTGTTNRGATFAYGDSTMAPVCFGKCTDCMASLDETLQNVSLFPNPTRGQFNLARMDAASEVEVSVLDLQGKVLTVATWNAGAESLGIDLGNFANGVYMVRLTSEEGSRTLRVSVQK